MAEAARIIPSAARPAGSPGAPGHPPQARRPVEAVPLADARPGASGDEAGDNADADYTGFSMVGIAG